MLKKSVFLVASGMILLLGHHGGAHAGEVDLCGGDAFLAELENQKALRAFQRCLGKAASLKDRAVIHLYLGIAQFSLLNKTEAEEEFRTALTLDATVQFPAMISPKIQDAFQKIHQESRPSRVSTKIDVPVQSPGTNPLVDAPGTDPLPSRGRSRWPAWLTAGVSLTSALTATGLYIASNHYEGRINDLSLSYQEGTDQHDQASTLALSGNIVMGVAAVSAALAVYFFFSTGESAAEETAALPRGARMSLGGITW